MKRPPASREDVRRIAAEAGWTLTVLDSIDVFSHVTPLRNGQPIPPVIMLWANDISYTPGEHGWRPDPMSAYSASFVFDVNLAREGW